jgi:DNA-binding PadR family transcriptional regulator
MFFDELRSTMHRHRHEDQGGHGGGYTRGRRFAGEQLQLLLLTLLADKPSHGYELIKALEARSDGFYQPSPGVIYPALTFLEERGDVLGEAEGNRKSYRLTPAGQERLAGERERADELMAGFAHMARKMRHLRGALAEEAGEDVWLPEFVAARRALKRALLQKGDAPPAEQKRVTAILERTVREIAGE